MTWQTYGDVAFYACALVTMAFSLLYLTTAPWWTTSMGRNIMSVMGSVALAFSYFAFAIFSGGIPSGFQQIRAILFTGIALAVGWRIVILVRHHIMRSLRASYEEEQDDLEDAR